MQANMLETMHLRVHPKLYQVHTFLIDGTCIMHSYLGTPMQIGESYPS